MKRIQIFVLRSVIFMVDLYVSPSCTSCRKARAWLEKHNIPVEERNIFSEPLTKKELLKILRMTEYGTEEIIFSHPQYI